MPLLAFLSTASNKRVWLEGVVELVFLCLSSEKTEMRQTPAMVKATLRTLRTDTFSRRRGTDRMNTTADADWYTAVLAERLGGGQKMIDTKV